MQAVPARNVYCRVPTMHPCHRRANLFHAMRQGGGCGQAIIQPRLQYPRQSPMHASDYSSGVFDWLRGRQNRARRGLAGYLFPLPSLAQRDYSYSIHILGGSSSCCGTRIEQRACASRIPEQSGIRKARPSSIRPAPQTHLPLFGCPTSPKPYPWQKLHG